MIYDLIEEVKDILLDTAREFYRRFKYILLIILLIGLISSILLLKKENPSEVESQQIYLLGITIENWGQWISIITIPYAGGWAIFQYKKNIASKKQEKAAEIARRFSADIVNKCGVINNVYKLSSLNDILQFDKKNYDNFKFFDTDELRKIYNEEFPTEFIDKKNQSQEELDFIYHKILLIQVTPHKTQKNQDTQEEKNEEKNDNQLFERNNPFILQNSNFPYHFELLVNEVLNELEYICMDISSNATDSSYIYQSLHQMFLRTIRTLAADISIYNISYYDKYYTNIIHVYNDWTARYIKDTKKEKRKKNKINKILNPKIKTV